MRLAREIVAIYHGDSAGAGAEADFTKTFSEGGVPGNIKTVKVASGTLLDDLLLQEGLVASKTDFRRLQKDGAITLDGNRISESPKVPIEKAGVVKVGKHRFLKIDL